MLDVRHWDAIIIGGGIIGLSLARELNKRGLRVLVVEKGEPGREASWAAGGMLVDSPLETKLPLRDLATASANMYPEFVRELEDESSVKIDLRDQGAIVFVDPAHLHSLGSPSPGSASGAEVEPLYALPEPLDKLEPATKLSGKLSASTPLFLKERSVDPRHLTIAAIAAAKHRGIDFSSGDHVLAVEIANGKAVGVRTNKTRFDGGIVVNCAGAWASQIEVHASGVTGASSAQTVDDSERFVPPRFASASFVPAPTRPVKGQMLCVAMPQKELVRHVIRTPDVYLIPRSDGRLLIGATQEEAGFDKQTVPDTIQKLRQAALGLVPKLAEARFLDAWAGLRPGTPDDLPILGTTETAGYFVATGHFRDGILLTPITARLMGQVIAGETPEFDLRAFAAGRFRH
jgi:glycine oxidase